MKVKINKNKTLTKQIRATKRTYRKKVKAIIIYNPYVICNLPMIYNAYVISGSPLPYKAYVRSALPILCNIYIIAGLPKISKAYAYL